MSTDQGNTVGKTAAGPETGPSAEEEVYARHQKVYPRQVHGLFANLRLLGITLLLGLYYGVAWLPWDGRQAVADAGMPVMLNRLSGTIEDPNARITPFKLMKGKQIYDLQNTYLIIPKLFGENGFWKTFDWDQSSRLGMESVDLPYSGKYGFIETEMYWPVNHMVAPANKALKCTACHTMKASKRIDWNALGYEDDPMRIGARKIEN